MPLRFALSPSRPGPELDRALEELCALISADTGVEVEPRCARSPDELAAMLSAGEAELAWLSPTLLLMTPGLSTMVPLLSAVRQGNAFFHAIVFAAETSGIGASRICPAGAWPGSPPPAHRATSCPGWRWPAAAST